MNDTSRQILSTNKSISTQVAKFCLLTSRFCKILSIKTLFNLVLFPIPPKFFLSKSPVSPRFQDFTGFSQIMYLCQLNHI